MQNNGQMITRLNRLAKVYGGDGMQGDDQGHPKRILWCHKTTRE
jgi:hypothetical protein